MKLFLKTLLYMFGMGDNPMPIDNHTDYEAIKSDWEKIGSDFYKAMTDYGKQQAQH